MRILLVSYYFPPFNSVGAVRPGKLARFLAEQGHSVRVLTCANQPFPDGLPLEIPADAVTSVPGWSVNAPVEWLRGGREKVARQGYGGTASAQSASGRLARLYKTALHWPDGQLGWVGAALRAGRQLVEADKFDLVYASAPPFSALRVAARLSRLAGVPWVAELRDLWTDNHAYAYPAWRRSIERCWESRLLASASALVTVSPPLAVQLQRVRKPVWEIRNGCDPEDFADLAPPGGFEQDSSVLNVVFTGNVYDGHYDVDSFCAGVGLFVGGGGRLRVHVAGRNSAALRDAARRHAVDSCFHFQGTVPRAGALTMQRHADVLLAFLWGGDGTEGVYSAKLFEYAGAGRPILAVGRDNDVGALIERSGLGQVAGSPTEVAGLLTRLRERKASEGSLQARPGPGHDFSRKSQFLELERRLQQLVGERACA